MCYDGLKGFPFDAAGKGRSKISACFLRSWENTNGVITTPCCVKDQKRQRFSLEVDLRCYFFFLQEILEMLFFKIMQKFHKAITQPPWALKIIVCLGFFLREEWRREKIITSSLEKRNAAEALSHEASESVTFQQWAELHLFYSLWFKHRGLFCWDWHHSLFAVQSIFEKRPSGFVSYKTAFNTPL